MKKISILCSLMLTVALLTASSALALPADHPYIVTLSTVAESGQMTQVAQFEARSDAQGKLTFQFDQVPDTETAPFLLVQVIDTSGGGSQLMRQSLVPAPTPGQAMHMGVNQTSHRRTQAALHAFNDSGQAEPIHLMLPQAMIASGALSDADTDTLGQLTGTASQAFTTYLTQAGVDPSQMTLFKTGLMAALRDLAAGCQVAVDEIDPVVASADLGRADGTFMRAVLEAGAAAGIDPEVVAEAFDQARLALDNAPGSGNLSPAGMAMLEANFLAGGQQRHLQARMRQYAEAMHLLDADPAQLQIFLDARAALHEAILQARQDFQQLFADPDNLPDPSQIDQARSTFQTAMQDAVDAFLQATTASDSQIAAMLGQMATGMGGGMMGGGMMTGTSLADMGFGRMQTTPGGTPQNWSTMMVVATQLAATEPNFSYQPATLTLLGELQQLQTTSELPPMPDWTALPDTAQSSLLHLQYDLMLVELIVRQARENLPQPLTAADQIQLNEQRQADLAIIRQGLQGLTAEQGQALLVALGPL